jgi:hypothetical protein
VIPLMLSFQVIDSWACSCDPLRYWPQRDRLQNPPHRSVVAAQAPASDPGSSPRRQRRCRPIL